MSRTIKEMVTKELTETLRGVNSLVVVQTVGLSGKDDNALRRGLHGKKIQLVAVKNSLARRALNSLGVSALDSLLQGPSALAWSRDAEIKDIAVELVNWKKK